MKQHITSLIKRLVQVSFVRSSITQTMALLARNAVPADILSEANPIVAVRKLPIKPGWPALFWRRAALIAADDFAERTGDTETALRTILYSIAKVPNEARIQVRFGELVGRSSSERGLRILKAISVSLPESGETHRAIFRALTVQNGTRFVRQMLTTDNTMSEELTEVIRAQCLEDLGEFELAAEHWRIAISDGTLGSRVAFAHSLAMRGKLNEALSELADSKHPDADRLRTDLIRRLKRANAPKDSELYLPAFVFRKICEEVRRRREKKPPDYSRPTKKFVIINASLGIGGAERQVVNTAIGLSRTHPELQVEVWVRSTDRRHDRMALMPELDAANVKVRSIQHFSDSTKQFRQDWPEIDPTQISEDIPFLDQTAFRVYNGLKQHKPDVVQFWQDATISLLGIGAFWAEVPHILLNFRSMPPPLKGKDRPYYLPFLQQLCNMPFVRISANSRQGALGYARWLGIPEQTFGVIRNGLLSMPEDVSPDVRETITIAGVMRLDENKRPDLWIEIAQQIMTEFSNVRFFLVGGGPLEREIANAVQSRSLGDRIQMTGAVADTSYYLKQADILLHIAAVEGLPNAVIEAQAHGCAVVATDAGGTKETFIDGQSGILIANADWLVVSEAVSALRALIQDPARLEQYKFSAQAFSHRAFSMETMIASTMKLVTTDS